MDVKAALTCFALILTLGLGCGKNETKPAEDSSKQQEKSAAVNGTSEMLIGTWYGRATLNQELLQQKLNQSPTPGDRATLDGIARVFQTTEIGAQFDADGNMTLDIQIQPGGQVLRDSTQGTWRLIETQENAIIVETTEPLPAGGTETNRVRYQFEQDGQLAIMVAPTSEQLADCHPVFVFERIVPTATNVADRAVNGSLK